MSEPSNETAATDPPVARPGTPCRTCGTPLLKEQDWCLECGASRKAKRWRTGRRQLILTSVLTTALLGVAVAASYAALSTSPGEQPTATVAIAQPQTPDLPPTSTSPPPLPATTTPPITTPTTASTPAATPSRPDAFTQPPQRQTQQPGTGAGTGAGVNTTTPTTTTPQTPTTTQTTTTTTTTEEPPPLVAIDLPKDSVALYDPEGRQLAERGGDPSRIFANAPGRAWVAQVEDPEQERLNVGVVIKLPKITNVKRIRFRTDTPGFTITVKGAYKPRKGETLEIPPTFESSTWGLLRSRKNVDGTKLDGNVADDGEEFISVPQDGREQDLALILLWITQQPEAGPPAQISSLKLLH